MRPVPMLDAVAITGARTALIAAADERLAQYPQYAGYFTGWDLYVITAVTGFKGGTMFVPGQIVLAAPTLTVHEGIPVTRSAYDVERGHVVAVPHENIRAVHCTDDYGHDATLNNGGCAS